MHNFDLFMVCNSKVVLSWTMNNPNLITGKPRVTNSIEGQLMKRTFLQSSTKSKTKVKASFSRFYSKLSFVNYYRMDSKRTLFLTKAKIALTNQANMVMTFTKFETYHFKNLLQPDFNAHSRNVKVNALVWGTNYQENIETYE